MSLRCHALPSTPLLLPFLLLLLLFPIASLAHTLEAPEFVEATPSGTFSYEAVFTAGPGGAVVSSYAWFGLQNVGGGLVADCFCEPGCILEEGETIVIPVEAELTDPGEVGRVRVGVGICGGGSLEADTTILPSGVVYDNTATYLNTENTLLAAGETDSREHGNQVTLAGTDRAVTSITAVLRLFGAGVATFDIRIRFYVNDGLGGLPGTLLWAGPLVHSVIDSGAPIAYTFTVPQVVVPDSFTWTLQISNRQGNMARMGPSEFNPPAVGSAPFGFWRRNELNVWEFTGLDEPPFGASVLAESAPVAVEHEVPDASRLHRLTVYPNPVSTGATFFYSNASELGGAGRRPDGDGPSRADEPRAVSIYDCQGRLVALLPLRSGAAFWAAGPGMPRGVYMARVVGGGASEAVKFTVLR